MDAVALSRVSGQGGFSVNGSVEVFDLLMNTDTNNWRRSRTIAVFCIQKPKLKMLTNVSFVNPVGLPDLGLFQTVPRGAHRRGSVTSTAIQPVTTRSATGTAAIVQVLDQQICGLGVTQSQSLGVYNLVANPDFVLCERVKVLRRLNFMVECRLYVSVCGNTMWFGSHLVASECLSSSGVIFQSGGKAPIIDEKASGDSKLKFWRVLYLVSVLSPRPRPRPEYSY